MAEPLTPATGWAVLHLFCRVPAAGARVDVDVLESAAADLAERDHQLVAVATLGHKADVALMAFGPDMCELRGFQAAVEASGLDIADSYLSLTEVSEYATGLPDETKEARLHPHLPPAGKRAWCFYPMSKRRDGAANWYLLDYSERDALMRAHGKVGREFAGRVLQLVTGSTGLDDYEWGVTLFGVAPDDLKECVYRMRFDEASAKYAEFGTFVSGIVCDSVEEALELAQGCGESAQRSGR